MRNGSEYMLLPHCEYTHHLYLVWHHLKWWMNAFQDWIRVGSNDVDPPVMPESYCLPLEVDHQEILWREIFTGLGGRFEETQGEDPRNCCPEGTSLSAARFTQKKRNTGPICHLNGYQFLGPKKDRLTNYPETKAQERLKDVLWVCFLDSKDCDVYYPNSTFNEGRNSLLRLALGIEFDQGSPVFNILKFWCFEENNFAGYSYFNFADDDIILLENTPSEENLADSKPLSQNPYT